MKMVSRFLDPWNLIGPYGTDSCVATEINCFPGFCDSRFNTELTKILLISQSWGSVWPPLERRSWHAFHPKVISSSVFCRGFLFHRLAMIVHSHPSRSSPCTMKGALAPLVLFWNKKRNSFFMVHCSWYYSSGLYFIRKCLPYEIETDYYKQPSCINWSLTAGGQNVGDTDSAKQIGNNRRAQLVPSLSPKSKRNAHSKKSKPEVEQHEWKHGPPWQVKR